MKEILLGHGWKYSHPCKICNGTAEFWLKENTPYTLKLSVKGYYLLYKNNRQIHRGFSNDIKDKLTEINKSL